MLHILHCVDGSAIVYARSRKRTKEIAEILNNKGETALFYHAGLDSSEKDERQKHGNLMKHASWWQPMPLVWV